MKHRARKMLGIVLCVAMVIGLIPWSVLTNAKADTATGKTIAGLGTSPIGNPTGSGQWHYVYYGKYNYNHNYNPVKYRVLSIKTTDFGGTTMLLDCDSTLYTAPFDSTSNSWENSSIKTELNGYRFLTMEGVFTPAESKAIASSTKATKNNDHDGSGWWDGNDELKYAPLTGQKIFLLDAVEATSSTYGYTDVSRMKRGASTPWWLRSPLSNNGSGAGIVFDSGNLGSAVISNKPVGVSPALNVNLSSVIFTSEIPSTEKTYKLTIKDSDISVTSIGVTREETGYSVPYEITGSNKDNVTQLSIVVTDATTTWTSSGWSSTAEPLQYTKLNVENFSTSGTGTFTLPSSLAGKTWGTDFNVYLVAEIVNSGNVTDYASAPVQLGIKNKIIDIPVNFKVIGGAWDDSGKKDDIVVHLTRREDEDKVLILRESDIPRVGNKPDDGFTAGSWDVNPTNYLDKVISKELTFTYTYDEKTRISKTVTFKVANGSWDDGTATDRTVTLNGHEGDTLKLSDGQIPAVGSKPADGFKEGSWDVTPSTETAITEDVTYTYTYSKKDTAVVTAAPKAKTGLVASGSPQELVTAGMASGGTMQYALGSDGTTVPVSGWDTAISVGTDAGTYYVWYKAVGDKDHLDSEAAYVTATIAENIPEEEKVEIKDLTEVPASLSGIYTTFSELENAMLLKLEIHGKPVEKNHVVFLDVELLVSFDGGITWTKATEDNFPPEGVIATLPYPAGTNAEDYDFAVSHMFTLTSDKLKTKAGDVENCPVTKTAKGLQVTLHGLSPVAIAWAEKNEPTPSPTPTPTASPTPSPTPTPTASPTPTPTAKPTPTSKPVPKTGDSAPLALWLGLVLAGIICLGTVIAQMRRSRKKEET